jgi:hypothetical protein
MCQGVTILNLNPALNRNRAKKIKITMTIRIKLFRGQKIALQQTGDAALEPRQTK